MPGPGGGGGRGGQRSSRPRPARAVAFCSPAESRSQDSISLSPLLHLGKHLFGAGKGTESPPASFSNLPPASSYSMLPREAELEERTANVLLFTRARRLGSPAPRRPPAAAGRTHTPRGHHLPSSGPCGRRKFPPKVHDPNTPRVRSSALTPATLPLRPPQTRVVPDPRII